MQLFSASGCDALSSPLSFTILLHAGGGQPTAQRWAEAPPLTLTCYGGVLFAHPMDVSVLSLFPSDSC